MGRGVAISPEPLERATLTAGQTIPGDRLYAIENGPSGFDPAAPPETSSSDRPPLREEPPVGKRMARPAHLRSDEHGRCSGGLRPEPSRGLPTVLTRPLASVSEGWRARQDSNLRPPA